MKRGEWGKLDEDIHAEDDSVDLDRIEEIALAYMEEFNRGNTQWKPANKGFHLTGLMHMDPNP